MLIGHFSGRGTQLQGCEPQDNRVLRPLVAEQGTVETSNARTRVSRAQVCAPSRPLLHRFDVHRTALLAP